MSWIGEMWRRVGMLVRRERFDHELDEEMRLHREMKERELVAGGEETEEARYAARRAFGNATVLRERGREAWGWRWLEEMAQDVRYGARMLRKNPGSTAAVVVALALGIGLNTTVFGFVNALLLRPPAGVEAPNALLELWLHNRGGSGIEGYLPLTYPDYVYYRDHNQSFSGMLAFDGDPESVTWNRAGEGQVVQGQLVSGNFFSVLGVNAVLGRTFFAEDDQSTNPQPVVVLGHSFWQQRFGADPDIVGKTLMLNGTNFSVVGVAPANFAGLEIAVEPDIWAPVTMVEQITRDLGRLTNRQGHWLLVAGRLKSAANAANAQAEASVLARQIEQDHPDTNKDLEAKIFPATLVPGPYRGYVSAFTGLLLAFFGLLLLIACANAVSLLLARATGRAREMAIRSALGAGRGRLIRQMLVESTLLSGLAGCAGLVLAYWTAPLLLALKPASLPLTLRVPLDWRVLVFTVLVSLLTGIAFGVVPALRSAKVEASPTLKEETQSAGARGSRLRNVLMVGEVATCVVLLIGATLCVRSLRNANSIDPGFETQHVATATLDPGMLGYTPAKVQEFYEQLSQHIGALPEVTSVSFVNHLPLGPAREQTATNNPERSAPDRDMVPTDVLRVAPGFFKTMGTPLLRGRDFTKVESEKAESVVIINETLARRLWPNQDPVGWRIRIADEKNGAEIVGVVKAGKYRTLGEEPTAAIYLPRIPGRRTMVVRTSGDASALLDAIRRELQVVDPNLAATDLVTMQQYMALPLFPARTTGFLLGASGVLALVLTSIGLFGVISYVVSQRTHEIGLRMALGARPRDVLRLVLGRGLMVTSIGLAVGLAAAFAATRLLSSLLYGIGPNDPVTLIGVSLGLTTVTLLACYLPTRRAMRVDPMVALRYE
jgi:predicted permease